MTRAHLLIDKRGSIRLSSSDLKLRKDVKDFHKRIFVRGKVRNIRRELQEMKSPAVIIPRSEIRKARTVSSPFLNTDARSHAKHEFDVARPAGYFLSISDS